MRRPSVFSEARCRVSATLPLQALRAETPAGALMPIVPPTLIGAVADGAVGVTDALRAVAVPDMFVAVTSQTSFLRRSAAATL